MGLLDGKYWVCTGVELLGVTEDEGKIKRILQDAFLEDKGFKERAEEIRPTLDVRLKFDSYRLTLNGIDVPGYEATNIPEL